MDTPAVERLVSDVERSHAVECLRAGATDGRLSLDEFADRVGDVYGARTAGELARVVADLPSADESPSRPVRRTRRIVGVLGTARLHGRWRPAEPTTAVAVVGGCQLDLSDAVVDGDVDIRAVAIFGGVEVLVPEGVAAELHGVVVCGSKDYRVRERSVRPGLPLVRVRATAVFGGVTVRTRPFTSGRWDARAEG
jgi:hypothetical protein